MAYNRAYQHQHSAMAPCCCINTTAKSREFIFKARETDLTMTVFYYIDMMSVSLLPEMHVYMGGCGQLIDQPAPAWSWLEANQH